MSKLSVCIGSKGAFLASIKWVKDDNIRELPTKWENS